MGHDAKLASPQRSTMAGWVRRSRRGRWRIVVQFRGRREYSRTRLVLAGRVANNSSPSTRSILGHFGVEADGSVTSKYLVVDLFLRANGTRVSNNTVLKGSLRYLTPADPRSARVAVTRCQRCSSRSMKECW